MLHKLFWPLTRPPPPPGGGVLPLGNGLQLQHTRNAGAERTIRAAILACVLPVDLPEERCVLRGLSMSSSGLCRYVSRKPLPLMNCGPRGSKLTSVCSSSKMRPVTCVISGMPVDSMRDAMLTVSCKGSHKVDSIRQRTLWGRTFFQLTQTKNSDRPVASSVFEHTIGRHLKGNQRRLEANRRRLEGKQRQLKSNRRGLRVDVFSQEKQRKSCSLQRHPAVGDKCIQVPLEKNWR